MHLDFTQYAGARSIHLYIWENTNFKAHNAFKFQQTYVVLCVDMDDGQINKKKS